jgi:hypothetical protein
VVLVEQLWFEYLEEWVAMSRYPIVQCFLAHRLGARKEAFRMARTSDELEGVRCV